MFASVVVGKVGYKFGIPALLMFLGVGMLFGSDGIGITFDSPDTTQFIGMIALSVILFSGGMDTKISDIRPVLGEGLTLATLGVLLTALIMGGFIYFVTNYVITGIAHLTLAESMLLAAVMSSTDSASVFSILRGRNQELKQNLKPMLELESGSNDPMAYMLTILIIQIIESGVFNIWSSLLMFVMQMSIGAAAGFLLGRGAVWLVKWMDVENKSLYSIWMLAVALFIFSLTDRLSGNGYLAVYIAGMVIGNSKLSHKESLTTFFEGITWLFQMVMFITLGLLVNPNELWEIALIGLLVGAFMMLFGRPVSVLICLAPFSKLTKKARTFVSWVGLRGAVPIIFATYPMIAGIENSRIIFNVVFFITIMSLSIQGTTVGLVATKLGLVEEDDVFTEDFEEGFEDNWAEDFVAPSQETDEKSI